MPTYEYRCNACKHEFEQFQSMKDKALKKCPSCGKNMLERLIGVGAAVIFKGSGFYQTDYRSESYKKGQSADKPAESTPASDSSASTKSETKTEKSGDTSSTKSEKISEPKPAKGSEKPAAKKSSSKKDD
jgi:putative FmdB family regulatory protein